MNLSDETKKKYGDPLQTKSVWGFGGYYANAIDAALRHDDADGFVELMRVAGLDDTAVTFDGLSMEKYCAKRGAAKCAKALSILRDQSSIREMSEQRRASA